MAAVLAPTFDPAAQVVIEGDSLPLSYDGTLEALNPAGAYSWKPVDSLHEGWNRRTIHLTASSPAYLVLAYTFYPGWLATIDNQPTHLWRANYTLMAVLVEPGSHEVVLTYRPWWLTVGTAISCLFLLISILLALPLRATKRKKIV